LLRSLDAETIELGIDPGIFDSALTLNSVSKEDTMLSKRQITTILLTSLIVGAFLCRNLFPWQRASASQEQAGASVGSLPGLRQRVTVERDNNGAPHVTSSSEHDAYFMMGYLHAQDRFFQMDTSRREAAGTLSELLGPGPDDRILEDDVLRRRIGLDRAAERSLSAYSPAAIALIQAYSDGVNAWLGANSLPPEYAALEVTQVPRWRPVDSISVSKFFAFQASFDLQDVSNQVILSEYQAAGEAQGFDGVRLYFEDLSRVAPFDRAVTTPSSADAASSSPTVRSLNLQSQVMENARRSSRMISPGGLEAARKLMERFNKSPLLNARKLGIGSNWWVVGGSKTTTGNAMLANDPHLLLGAPATFYQIHLRVDSGSSPLNVSGVSFPGFPGVFLGQNERISWGATVCALDVTDIYLESLVLENGASVATRFKDRIEPLVISPQIFKVNQVQNGVADDVVTVDPGERPSGAEVPSEIRIVPRRNNGPLFPSEGPQGVSVQYTGLGATREVEGLFALARARNLNDFKAGLQLLDVGSLNWAYADIDGNIATFTNAEVPLREDLQAGTIDGVPPFLVRDGSGTFRNEWIPRNGGGSGLNFESLPFNELPQAVNPARGFLVNANNDPIGVTLDNDLLNKFRRDGDGIYYISSGFNPGFRAAKITSLLNQEFDRNRGHGKVSFQDMQRMQANVQMFDAEVFTPYIIRAFAAGRRAGAPAELAALARDPAVREAVVRLLNWDFSAPTGISEGYDAAEVDGVRRRPSDNEVFNSVAATIYTVWRREMVDNTISATLQRVGLQGVVKGSEQLLVSLRFLLDNFSTNRGVGGSGLDFFEIPGVNASPEVRRDAIILRSLKEGLNILASEAFADAFGGSTNQNDYRWGKLHRVTFGHRFGSLAPQFSIPTAGGFADLTPALPGLAIDGGFETIDNGAFEIVGVGSRAFTFIAGPGHRYVSELRRYGINAAQILSGGESGVIGSQFYANQLSLWLTNDYRRVLFTDDEIECNRFSKTVYRPSN
jgi:penicillin G amidase